MTKQSEIQDRLHEAGDTIREKTDAARAAASDAYDTALEKVSDVAGRAASGINANPVIALVGGIALGVIAGALLPRSERETALLGGVGGRLNDAARSALTAGREAGEAKLAELGFSQDAAREQVSKLFGNLGEVAGAAGTAATGAARGNEAD